MARKLQSYFFNSEFQTKMLQIFVGISLIQGAFFATVSYGLISNVEKAAAKSGIDADHLLFESLRIEQTYMNLMILAGILISAVFFTWLGLKYSFEAMGAIYHLKKDLQKMTKDKKLSKVKLRKNDYFKDFEATFNEMVQTLNPNMSFDTDRDEFTPTPTPANKDDKAKN